MWKTEYGEYRIKPSEIGSTVKITVSLLYKVPGKGYWKSAYFGVEARIIGKTDSINKGEYFPIFAFCHPEGSLIIMWFTDFKGAQEEHSFELKEGATALLNFLADKLGYYLE